MRSATLWRDKFYFLLGLTKGNKSSPSVDIYPETAYHGLIRSEVKRSERSGQLCRVLLVYHINAQGAVVPLKSELVDKTISVLSRSCRDTDYIGWYWEGRILGVLLTALRPDSAGDGCRNLKARLVDSVRGALTFMDDHSLQIRVLELSELTTFNAADHPASIPGTKD